MDAPSDLKHLIERMMSWHPDERPLPEQVIEAVSGYMVGDEVVIQFLEGRTGFQPAPGMDHPLVGAELGEGSIAELEPDKVVGPRSPPGRPPPRPVLPPRPVGRFDDGGRTIFVRDAIDDTFDDTQEAPGESAADHELPDAPRERSRPAEEVRGEADLWDPDTMQPPSGGSRLSIHPAIIGVVGCLILGVVALASSFFTILLGLLLTQ